MERITSKRPWDEAQADLRNEMGYSHIWTRLNAIENILGDDYDLDQLKELLESIQAEVKSPHPDGDSSILACPCCGSGEYLQNEDGNENRFCGQCGQRVRK